MIEVLLSQIKEESHNLSREETLKMVKKQIKKIEMARDV